MVLYNVYLIYSLVLIPNVCLILAANTVTLLAGESAWQSNASAGAGVGLAPVFFATAMLIL